MVETEEEVLGLCVPQIGFGGIMAPFFENTGKKARDILNGYIINIVKLDVKTITTKGVEFSGSAVLNKETNKTSGDIGMRYTSICKDYNISCGMKCTTDSILVGEVTCADFPLELCQGLKTMFLGKIAFQADKTSTFSAKTYYNNENYALNGEFVAKSMNPTLNIGLVGAYNNLFAGFYSNYVLELNQEAELRNIPDHKLTVGYADDEFAMTAYLNTQDVFELSFYHKIDDLDVAIQLEHGPNFEENMKITVGGKYYINPNFSIKAKFSSDSTYSLGFQTFGHGISLTLCFLFNNGNVYQNDFGLGIAIEI